MDSQRHTLFTSEEMSTQRARDHTSEHRRFLPPLQSPEHVRLNTNIDKGCGYNVGCTNEESLYMSMSRGDNFCRAKPHTKFMRHTSVANHLNLLAERQTNNDANYQNYEEIEPQHEFFKQLEERQQALVEQSQHDYERLKQEEEVEFENDSKEKTTEGDVQPVSEFSNYDIVPFPLPVMKVGNDSQSKIGNISDSVTENSYHIVANSSSSSSDSSSNDSNTGGATAIKQNECHVHSSSVSNTVDTGTVARCVNMFNERKTLTGRSEQMAIPNDVQHQQKQYYYDPQKRSITYGYMANRQLYNNNLCSNNSSDSVLQGPIGGDNETAGTVLKQKPAWPPLSDPLHSGTPVVHAPSSSHRPQEKMFQSTIVQMKTNDDHKVSTSTHFEPFNRSNSVSFSENNTFATIRRAQHLPKPGGSSVDSKTTIPCDNYYDIKNLKPRERDVETSINPHLCAETSRCNQQHITTVPVGVDDGLVQTAGSVHTSNQRNAAHYSYGTSTFYVPNRTCGAASAISLTKEGALLKDMSHKMERLLESIDIQNRRMDSMQRSFSLQHQSLPRSRPSDSSYYSLDVLAEELDKDAYFKKNDDYEQPLSSQRPRGSTSSSSDGITTTAQVKKRKGKLLSCIR